METRLKYIAAIETIKCVIILIACMPVSTGMSLAAAVGKSISLPCRLPYGFPDDRVIDMFAMIQKDRSIKTLRMKRGETCYSRHTSTTSAVVKVMWFMGNTRVAVGTAVYHNAPRFEINKPVPNELNLVIKSVVKSDDAIFRCKSFERVYSEIELEVQWKPVFDESYSSPFKVVMTEGVQSQLKCTTEGNPPPVIKWYRRPQQVDSRFSEIGVTGQTLTLPSVTRYVNDVFKCEASNVQGTVFREMNVTVNFAPDVKIMEDDMYVQAGKQVIVTCLVQGSPLVDFYWQFKNGVEIKTDWKYMVHKEHQPGYPAYFLTLMIRENTLGDYDFGTYVCHADGLGQEAEASIQISELKKTKIHKAGR